ncbi:MAG: hypothetical protein GX115_02125 [Ruminiclostridium sp.]|nr:hypothetical protein [Ruminiclostridium sp.]
MIAVISTTAFLTLWFWIVNRELRSKADTVNSAVSQLTACRENQIWMTESSDEQAGKYILSRSLDIYHQSVMLYNQTLLKPWNRFPAFLMGFRQMKDEKTISERKTMPAFTGNLQEQDPGSRA